MTINFPDWARDEFVNNGLTFRGIDIGRSYIVADCMASQLYAEFLCLDELASLLDDGECILDWA